jgi:hypothetical protein
VEFRAEPQSRHGRRWSIEIGPSLREGIRSKAVHWAAEPLWERAAAEALRSLKDGAEVPAPTGDLREDAVRVIGMRGSDEARCRSGQKRARTEARKDH